MGEEYSINQKSIEDLKENSKDEKPKVQTNRIKLVSKQESEMLITAPTPLLPLNIYNEQSGRSNNNIIESGGYEIQHTSTIRRKKKYESAVASPFQSPF
jgi:hypothetical protein